MYATARLGHAAHTVLNDTSSTQITKIGMPPGKACLERINAVGHAVQEFLFGEHNNLGDKRHTPRVRGGDGLTIGGGEVRVLGDSGYALRPNVGDDEKTMFRRERGVDHGTETRKKRSRLRKPA